MRHSLKSNRSYLDGKNKRAETQSMFHSALQAATDIHGKAILLGAFAAGLAFGLLCNGCGNAAVPCTAVFPDGSSSCDEPVMTDDLSGKWCDPRPGQLLCLEVTGAAGFKSYTWAASDCFEVGSLSGGIEFSPLRSFNPDGTPLCFAPATDDGAAFYFASVDYTGSGMRLFIDGQDQPLELTYTPLPGKGR